MLYWNSPYLFQMFPSFIYNHSKNLVFIWFNFINCTISYTKKHDALVFEILKAMSIICLSQVYTVYFLVIFVPSEARYVVIGQPVCPFTCPSTMRNLTLSVTCTLTLIIQLLFCYSNYLLSHIHVFNFIYPTNLRKLKIFFYF